MPNYGTKPYSLYYAGTHTQPTHIHTLALIHFQSVLHMNTFFRNKDISFCMGGEPILVLKQIKLPEKIAIKKY